MQQLNWKLECGNVTVTGTTDATDQAGASLIISEVLKAIDAAEIVNGTPDDGLGAVVTVDAESFTTTVGDMAGLGNLQDQLDLAWKRVRTAAAVRKATAGVSAEAEARAKEKLRGAIDDLGG